MPEGRGSLAESEDRWTLVEQRERGAKEEPRTQRPEVEWNKPGKSQGTSGGRQVGSSTSTDHNKITPTK